MAPDRVAAEAGQRARPSGGGRRCLTSQPPRPEASLLPTPRPEGEESPCQEHWTLRSLKNRSARGLRPDAPPTGDRHRPTPPLPAAQRTRGPVGRTCEAATSVIESQSVKAVETARRDSHGYDGAKKANGRKQHLVVDTKSLPLFVMVTPADMTDREAAKSVLFRPRGCSRGVDTGFLPRRRSSSAVG
ncbi:transposase [Streptomyces sp. NPDC051014]|uniref:transposase n=1 Tax=Streptomyces sp. NPDC051014 TaxID=3155751 RepID=UPI0033C2D5B4